MHAAKNVTSKYCGYETKNITYYPKTFDFKERYCGNPSKLCIPIGVILHAWK